MQRAERVTEMYLAPAALAAESALLFGIPTASANSSVVRIHAPRVRTYRRPPSSDCAGNSRSHSEDLDTLERVTPEAVVGAGVERIVSDGGRPTEIDPDARFVGVEEFVARNQLHDRVGAFS